VVQLAAEKSGWGKQKLGSGFGMGIAVHRSFLTYVATVAQVEVKDGQTIVHRLDSALDAGTVVNPTIARQQFEGAAVMGTGIAFYGEITATNGVIDQSNFDTFQVTRMNAAPKQTNIHLVESEAPPAGIGEPGLPPVAPAIYNAIFAATGKRVREMPLAKVGLA
jgi:isoquinoline 1-oxidoreductase beta subunit